MVRRASVPALVALPLAGALGALLGGGGAAASAAVGVAVVYGNFAVHGLSLAWASRISIAMVQATALVGPVVRLGAILGLMFALDRLTWFSPVAFGWTVVPGTLLLLAYEARLAIRGLGGMLEIPPDPAAARAGRALSAREAR